MIYCSPKGCQHILPGHFTIDREELAKEIAGHDEWMPPDTDAALKELNIRVVPDARDALYHARASIVASGTATVQAAVIGNPFVVVYRVSPLTFRLAKRLVHYPAEIWPPTRTDSDGNLPIAMVNLIAGHWVVPELLQERFTAENVAAALHPLLSDGFQRDQMIADLAQVRHALQPPPGTGSIQQVCDAAEALLSENALKGGPKSTMSV